jgi:alpha/beta superfamily hydrolase
MTKEAIPIVFASGSLQLEGRLQVTSTVRAVAITHPHPLYGGNMANGVVKAVAAGYLRAGISVLRFNFRGVGRSQGQYDGGHGELDDLQAAVAHLYTHGFEQVELAGYSFGAWVNSGLDPQDHPFTRQVMVSPPVALMPFTAGLHIARLVRVVTGEEDDIAPPVEISRLLAGWNSTASLETIPGADHFYGGKMCELTSCIHWHASRHEAG